MMSFLLWIAAKRNGCSMFHVVDEMPIRKIKKEKKKKRKKDGPVYVEQIARMYVQQCILLSS